MTDVSDAALRVRAEQIFGEVIEKLTGSYIKRDSLGTIATNNPESITAILDALRTLRDEAQAAQREETIGDAGAAICTDCRRGHSVEQREGSWYHEEDWCEANNIYSACGYAAIRQQEGK